MPLLPAGPELDPDRADLSHAGEGDIFAGPIAWWNPVGRNVVVVVVVVEGGGRMHLEPRSGETRGL